MKSFPEKYFSKKNFNSCRISYTSTIIQSFRYLAVQSIIAFDWMGLFPGFPRVPSGSTLGPRRVSNGFPMGSKNDEMGTHREPVGNPLGTHGGPNGNPGGPDILAHSSLVFRSYFCFQYYTFPTCFYQLPMVSDEAQLQLWDSYAVKW